MIAVTCNGCSLRCSLAVDLDTREVTGGGCAKGREMLRVLDPDGEEEPPAKKIEKTGSGR